MVTYESNFIVDYDRGGGDKIKIKHLKNIANDKTQQQHAVGCCCEIKCVRYCSEN
jgi:transcriptional regulator CtsR